MDVLTQMRDAGLARENVLQSQLGAENKKLCVMQECQSNMAKSMEDMATRLTDMQMLVTKSMQHQVEMSNEMDM